MCHSFCSHAPSTTFSLFPFNTQIHGQRDMLLISFRLGQSGREREKEVHTRKMIENEPFVVLRMNSKLRDVFCVFAQCLHHLTISVPGPTIVITRIK